MDVIPSGMVMLVIPEWVKAEKPIEVIPSGIMIFVRAGVSKNAPEPIAVMFLGKIIVCNPGNVQTSNHQVHCQMDNECRL